MLLKCHGNTHALFISMTKYKHFCYPELNHNWELEGLGLFFSPYKAYQYYQSISVTRQACSSPSALTLSHSTSPALCQARWWGQKPVPVFPPGDRCTAGPMSSGKTFQKEAARCHKNYSPIQIFLRNLLTVNLAENKVDGHVGCPVSLQVVTWEPPVLKFYISCEFLQ